MTRHRISSTEIRRGFRDILDHLTRGDEVIVVHYDRPVALITPYRETTVTLSDLARELHTRHGDTYDEALTAVTTYAAQLDYQVPAGGQSPQTVVSEEDAEHIRNAYAAGVALDAERA